MIMSMNILLLLYFFIAPSAAWIGEKGAHRPSTNLFALTPDEQRKMAMVRSIQMQFYKSAASEGAVIDKDTGVIPELPLWRVPWTELPGRSNVLHVHEAVYTNMFETVLYGKKPWYIGHINRGTADNSKVATWHARPRTPSAVVGTLLEIVDYRRFEDGRLLILVQALERFVVNKVVQELPYGVASVQLLPDMEEIDPDLTWTERTEREIRGPRAAAIQDSFQTYHNFEYDEAFELPVPDRADLSISDIYGPSLALILPFAPLSKTANACQDVSGGVKVDATVQPNLTHAIIEDAQPCLEGQLLDRGILQYPSKSAESMGDLEVKIWLALDRFLKRTKTPVSPALLGILPPVKEWPSDFALRKIADEIANRTDVRHNYVAIAPHFPAHRRCRLLSFSAANVLEDKKDEREKSQMRQKLLEIASTRGRMMYVLEQFKQENDEHLGEYQ
ncbi:hypothetical protein FisN_8Hh223 [Fistulifera solaris]|jgi:Lon protease-like protein|uniref:Lon N-terminal domain-containing protein n=1 Tax=Fistulifera solaris TaxID=1519565 RepID=A0A1Z5JYQ6_FISSO|nr:hypothetical protein FisN_8Hh223 [Fistulifera solaris]|eukprot:GAX19002.1 hypothetical protein FisN_8Hh223 [Fistulifera solaris]